MTRQQVENIVFMTHSPLTVDEVMKAIDEYAEDIRADERTKTIEEFVKAMESIDKQSGGLGIDIIDVWDVAEELKEKSK